MFGLKPDVSLDLPDKYFVLKDYEKGLARWCPGCGSFSVLTSLQKLCREKQLAPENTVIVSGIGCSSRFPHYMNTYGFHGLHGRALPVACGIKFRRPDLHVIVTTGDGDCCSIGTGHWIHAIRYNMDITVLMFDNQIYGLTKMQISPTSGIGTKSNTTPQGSILPPINPIQTTLGVGNTSFVAQTVDWNPPHMYATFSAAFDHPGFSFVRIYQRCPVFKPALVDQWTSDTEHFFLITHENGIHLDEKVKKTFKNQVEHDPSDIIEARKLAADPEKIFLGLFYQNKEAIRYDLYGSQNLGMTAEEKKAAIEVELDKYAV